MFTSGKAFFGRLTEVEKMRVRAAQTPDRLAYIFDAHHRYEFGGTLLAAQKAFMEAVNLVREEFTSKGTEEAFGLTWKL